MAIFFGTDGIRGEVNEFLTHELAYKCGNAIAGEKNNATILIGGDTRVTRSFLTSAFASGAMAAGANIIDVGVCPTAGIAYLTRQLGMDFGVVVSASHNPAKYNGIKIFDHKGFKLGDNAEEALERKFVNNKTVDWGKIGSFHQDHSLIKLYENFLISCCEKKLDGLTIVLDAGYGAAYKVAARVFKKLGAKVKLLHCKNKGLLINDGCGSLYPNLLVEAVKKHKADLGMAFDGDSDRIIACDETGKILDGDIILFIIAKYLKKTKRLSKNTIVGTSHTNIGIENELQRLGINLIRTDIGDKYVIAKMLEEGLDLGGEKSGHIIIREFATTGDGILSGIMLAAMSKLSGERLSKLAAVKLCPQINIDCVVSDKLRVVNSEKLTETINEQRKILGGNARVMVRCSGTEPKIRIMVECDDEKIAAFSAMKIEKIVYEIDTENKTK